MDTIGYLTRVCTGQDTLLNGRTSSGTPVREPFRPTSEAMQTRSRPPEDPLRSAEYAIGFESLRYIAQLEAARAGSGAALARELAIAPPRLQRFLSGADPSREVWEALTAHVRRLPAPRPLAPVGLLGFAVVAE